MNHLLKAMGFWVWGLIAIGLSASMVSVSFKVLSIYREHSISIARPDSSNRSMPVAAAPATASKTPVAPKKDSAAAKQAFAKLSLLPNLSPRVLKLWNLYADMIPETVSEPL